MVKSKTSDVKLGGRERMCWQCGETFHTDMEMCPNDGARLIELSTEDKADPLIGQVFDGRFRIYKKLGEGGMGTVYSARRLDFESDVALKLLKVDFARDDGIRKRFLYEARVISNLKHPHVVRLYDFGQTSEGHYYMVMELLDGESLADRLAYRFVSYREMFDIVPPICGVLGEAHAQDVIHRDLKPENIYLLKVDENAEFPKLLDFGIAKHIREETMTQSGTLWGTPAYMSPEQAKGDVVGARADVYAIGIIIYELISGNLPFHASTQMGFAVKHLNEPARALSTIPGLDSVPPELDEFVLRLLAKAKDDRPANMEEVAHTLLTIREKYFDDALLDTIPAELVDPIGLQEWIKSAPDISQPLPAVVDTSAQHIPIPATAADTGERATLAVLGRGPSQSADEGLEEDVGFGSLHRDRRVQIGAGGAVLLLVVLLVVMFSSSGDETVVPVELPVVEGPVDISNVVGAAVSQAAHVIVGARSVAAEVQTDSLIIVDEVEMMDKDGKVRTMKKREPAKTSGNRVEKAAEEEKVIRRALEGTF
ncbi:MAG: serine/threonine protein kinase [Bradymonadaceae bacterium]